MNNLIILDTEKRPFPSSIKPLVKLYSASENLYIRMIYSFFIVPKIKKYIQKDDCRVIAIDKETEIMLKNHNISYLTLADYLNEREYLAFEKKTVNYVRDLPNQFPEIDVKYMDISLWKMDEADIFYSFLRNKLTTIDIIRKIIDKESAKKLIILNSSSAIGNIQKNFKRYVEVSDKTNLISKFRKMFFKLLVPFAIKTIHFDFTRKMKYASKTSDSTKKIIFFEGERSFYYACNFLKKFKENLTILHTQEYSKKIEDFNYTIIDNYIDPKSKLNLMLFKKELKDKLKELMKSKIYEKINYENIPVFKSSDELFIYLFNSGYLQSAILFEGLNNMFTKNKIKLIITHGECIKKNKIIVALSKKYNVRSLFIMHGTVGERDLYDNMLSDKTAVFGPYYKKALVRMNNSGKNIIITGNPAWDSIKNIKLSRNQLYSKLNLPDKKIILLATTHFPWDVKIRMAYAIFKVMSDFKDFHLVVKMHPEEEPDFYRDMMKKFNVNATIVDDITLLHPLIKYSEVVVITDSTVGLETIMLDKPLIDMSLSTVPYWNDYVEEKAAIGVRKEEELLPAIKSILENKKIRDKLKKNRKKYIYEHAYKQDGKASERVINLISNMIKNNK